MDKSNDWRSPENANLLNNVCAGLSPAQKDQFVYTCKLLDLNPLVRQVYPVSRDGKLTIQTSIDGFRLIAERTGRYAPGKEALYIYDDENKLVSVTVYVKKMTPDGTWHEVPATAHYSEYVCYKSGGTIPNVFWKTKPHIMLAKCAEALALRKAFPAELSGVYTDDEMGQASNIIPQKEPEKEPEMDIPVAAPEPTKQQIFEDLVNHDKTLKEKIEKMILSKGYKSMNDLSEDTFEKVLKWMQNQVAKAGGVA